MALIKKHTAPVAQKFPDLVSLEDAIRFYQESAGDLDAQRYATDNIALFEGGGIKLVSLMSDDPRIDKDMASYISSLLTAMEPDRAPIEAIMGLLSVRNAYIRNLGITTLQSYGEAIRYYIVKFLIGDDRDLRIFAINVLGDVNFAESREMLVELLESELDINVASTAVDYLSEIGEIGDIPLLESIKERFHDPYIDFAVDTTIKAIRG
ncbi:MAG: HEAT repeat domain-containing protein [Sulfuricurvum sp.]|uniref:HEAT repeat domain-containing protein n=1 Tax=Sulfuricurvum sp. TaxID=2025608 RepID=UPI002614A7B5|nr:HEAT repeat domain-containing protein [Sulfuricurvum sp.]MDD2828705.1 HEAT repeat domain-containing protein [Sulfuricurvum sp.]MDD4949283.1 HEAT repeat domain-containing protein [Sulfuricurvum sp.]